MHKVSLHQGHTVMCQMDITFAQLDDMQFVLSCLHSAMNNEHCKYTVSYIMHAAISHVEKTPVHSIPDECICGVIPDLVGVIPRSNSHLHRFKISFSWRRKTQIFLYPQVHFETYKQNKWYIDSSFSSILNIRHFAQALCFTLGNCLTNPRK